jgi:hypothetical protein
MSGSNFMQGWMVLAGSLVLIALILTAFGLMLGIGKPADALKRVGAILGIVIVLMPIPGVLVGAWSGNISVATYRSGRDWGRSLAVAATAVAAVLPADRVCFLSIRLTRPGRSQENTLR